MSKLVLTSVVAGALCCMAWATAAQAGDCCATITTSGPGVHETVFKVMDICDRCVDKCCKMKCADPCCEPCCKQETCTPKCDPCPKICCPEPICEYPDPCRGSEEEFDRNGTSRSKA